MVVIRLRLLCGGRKRVVVEVGVGGCEWSVAESAD